MAKSAKAGLISLLIETLVILEVIALSVWSIKFNALEYLNRAPKVFNSLDLAYVSKVLIIDVLRAFTLFVAFAL